jgi:hypothetical protein
MAQQRPNDVVALNVCERTEVILDTSWAAFYVI